MTFKFKIGEKVTTKIISADYQGSSGIVVKREAGMVNPASTHDEREVIPAIYHVRFYNGSGMYQVIPFTEDELS